MADTQHELIEQEAAPAPVATQGDALLSLIDRAARDREVDMDKMERLLQMHERIEAQRAEAAYSDALAEMQPELPVIEKRGASNNGKYAKWEHIQSGIMPVIAKHGFSLQFKSDTSDGEVKVTAILRHRAGHKDETTFTLKPDTSGNKQPVHAVASAVSYAKRYAASGLLNITAVDEDDDGNGASRGETINEQQAEVIRDKLKAAKRTEAKLCSHMGFESVDNIPEKRFREVCDFLDQFIPDPSGDES